MKGVGPASANWFKAEKNSSGTYELTSEGKTEMAAAIASANSGGSGGSGC